MMSDSLQPVLSAGSFACIGSEKWGYLGGTPRAQWALSRAHLHVTHISVWLLLCRAVDKSTSYMSLSLSHDKKELC